MKVDTAASVSERARELLATECGVSPELVDEYQDRDVIVRLALRAIEQALTQQRRECPRTWPCAKHPRAEIKTDGFPIEPLKVFDLGPWTWTETGHQFTGIDLDGAAFSAYRDYFNGTTTPQPSADAVREVVERWRSAASENDKLYQRTKGYEHKDRSDTLDACADELESLLSGGSHA